MKVNIIQERDGSCRCEVTHKGEVIFAGRPYTGPDARRKAQKDGDRFLAKDEPPKQKGLFD